MGLFSGVKKVVGGLLGGGPKPKVEKIDPPDYASLWKTYQGWVDNVNQGVNKEIGEIRARLAASGASDEVITRQVEFLEGQRKSQLDEFEMGPTATQLREGFDIAAGRKDNPYNQKFPGQVKIDEGVRVIEKMTENFTGQKVDFGSAAKGDFPGTWQEYYGKYYSGEPATSQQVGQPEPGAKPKPAGQQGGAPGGGPASPVLSSLNMWLTDEKQTGPF